jgi:hypothetical protein
VNSGADNRDSSQHGVRKNLGFPWACPKGTDNSQATTIPLDSILPFIRQLFRREPEQLADEGKNTNELAFGSGSVVIPTGASPVEIFTSPPGDPV